MLIAGSYSSLMRAERPNLGPLFFDFSAVTFGRFAFFRDIPFLSCYHSEALC